MSADKSASVARNRPNWIMIFNLLGVAAIVGLGLFVLETVRGTEEALEKALEPNIAHLSAAQAHEMLSNNASAYMVDVRGAESWAQNMHINGAQHVEMANLQTRFLELWPDPNAEIIIFSTEDNLDSQAAVEYLLSKGYSQVYNLQGGFESWEAAGLPIVPAEQTQQ